MKKHLFSFLIVLTFAFGISAQEKEAELYDEFGVITCEHIRKQLDLFIIELNNRPNSYGYVITYDGRYEGKLSVWGETYFLTNQIIRHFKHRNFPLNRILFVNGGFRENYIRKFYIVPKRTKPPKPKPTLDKMRYRKGKLKGIICNEG